MKLHHLHHLKAAAALCLFAIALKAAAEPVTLQPAPSPADNPLKGLVPYANPDPGGFPHSLEFDYLRFADLMPGPQAFDWRPLEQLLGGVANRGNQAIIRVWLEYPGKDSGLPAFLREAGVKVTSWENSSEKKRCHTPDYRDERLVRSLETFIHEFGRNYDGDPRLGFITAGLLGSWGEWHTHPREDLFAPVTTQRRVLAAYQRAFQKTPVLIRYPAGENQQRFAPNANLPFGYHDDSFAWGTLDTGRQEDGWFYLPSLKAAGAAALNKWRTQPIGGEVRPEVWGQIHDAKPRHKQAQDFLACVEQTHVSWLMESGLFERKPDPERHARAAAHVRRMGYDFHVQTVEIGREGPTLKIGLSVVNQGVAPFYQDWRLELAALDAKGRITRRWPVAWKLTGLLPGDPPRVWQTTMDRDESCQGQILALRVIHPLPNGKPLRFANADQDRHLPGWLSLGVLP